MVPDELYEKAVSLNEKYRMFSVVSRPAGDHQSAGDVYSYKDNICVRGMPAQAGSKILDGYVPPFDATVVERLGGAVLGKTNMDEFGFGTFSANSATGVPRNSFNPEHVAGGSSGGAAVAAALIPEHVAIAESTGGSISCPASFNGVVGLTPTYGRVSRYGLIDYANSLDKIGVISSNSQSAFGTLRKMSGPDTRDSTSMNEKNVPFDKTPVKKVAIVKNLIDDVDESVKKAFWRAVDSMDSVEFEEIEMPSLKYALASYYVIATAEASTNLARYCGLRYGLHGERMDIEFNEYFTSVRSRGFGKEAKRRIVLGTFVRMAGYRDQYYYKALAVRNKIISDYKRMFKSHDLLLTPTMPVMAPRFEDAENMKPLDVYMLDALTVPPNLAGLPHISLPAGYEPMPVGIQFIADHWMEGKLEYIADYWESLFEYRRPGDAL